MHKKQRQFPYYPRLSLPFRCIGGDRLRFIIVLSIISSLGLAPNHSVIPNSSKTIEVQDVIESSPSPKENDTVNPYAYRSGRRTYRAPRSGNTGVVPGTNRTGQRPGDQAPVGRTPAARPSPFGGFFGGLFAGTLLGSLLNPFGYGGFGGFGGINVIGLLFWGAILYMAYRLIRRVLSKQR